MDPLLCGIETEYGLYVDGRGAEEQIEDAQALVRSYPGERFSGWDYRFESPRADLRGFQAEKLAIDPTDAAFDRGKTHGSDHEVRADQVLPNGARFYNDHGHPEYATPECWDIDELVRHDVAGQIAVLRAAAEFSKSSGLSVSLYKNNTDFQGAAYGTHESYLVPREVGLNAIYVAVLPILVIRQILCGAGKVGAETGPSGPFQLSARSEFFSELQSVDTLFRRPIFNTRDEPHADPAKWMRLHVIATDANMLPSSTWRRIALMQLALCLEIRGLAPKWELAAPINDLHQISRNVTGDWTVSLFGGDSVSAQTVLESYLVSADKAGMSSPWVQRLAAECRELFASLATDRVFARQQIDWVAKKHMLDQFVESEGGNWDISTLRAFDLEYHNADPEQSLAVAAALMNGIEIPPPEIDLLVEAPRDTRAALRGHAVKYFADQIQAIGWRSVTFRFGSRLESVELPVDYRGTLDLSTLSSVELYIEAVRAIS